ncbi:MAG TPA: Hg(II)-responsive transcriptional regulator [Casimicrobiaceae bacterium]
MEDIARPQTIGALAAAAGLNVETIRYYQRRGLMPQPDRPAGGIRRYDGGALARVRFIKGAQRLGFSLDEVAELLKLADGTRCGDARGLAERKLRDVREKLAELRRIESALDRLVADCSAVRGAAKCPLIASLHRTSTARTR